MAKIEISVILVTYNSNWEKVKKTIDSIVEQKKICSEIIIADDGSKENLKSSICDYLTKVEYFNYTFVESRVNRGTVLNIDNALMKAKYFWVKIISPGDMLYDDLTLFRWISFMIENEVKMSFGRSIYYKENGEIQNLVEFPINKKVFMNDSYSKKSAFLDYIFLKDVPNGASFLGEKDIYIKYISQIKHKIKYAEDMAYRIMLASGIDIVYFYEPVIWYEYGGGVSTSGNLKWKKIIDDERIICNEIILQGTNDFNFMNCRIRGALKLSKRVDFFKYLLIPKLIELKIRKKNSVSYTLHDALLKKILEQKCNYDKDSNMEGVLQ